MRRGELADPKPRRDLPDRVTPLGDLRDRIPLEIVAEPVAAHHGLLASKLAKKASTRHGAIQSVFRIVTEAS